MLVVLDTEGTTGNEEKTSNEVDEQFLKSKIKIQTLRIKDSCPFFETC